MIRLVEQRRLSLADTLALRLPGVPPDKAQITIAQLLAHRSGLRKVHAREGAVNSPAAWSSPSWALLGAGGVGMNVYDLIRFQRALSRGTSARTRLRAHS